MAAAAATPLVASSLLDISDELFARIAPYLSLGDVCRLRATCRRLLRCSAVLAGGCKPQQRNFERKGKCVPETVLAWAVGRRHMQVNLIRSETLGSSKEDHRKRRPGFERRKSRGVVFALFFSSSSHVLHLQTVQCDCVFQFPLTVYQVAVSFPKF